MPWPGALPSLYVGHITPHYIKATPRVIKQAIYLGCAADPRVTRAPEARRKRDYRADFWGRENRRSSPRWSVLQPQGQFWASEVPVVHFGAERHFGCRCVSVGSQRVHTLKTEISAESAQKRNDRRRPNRIQSDSIGFRCGIRRGTGRI